MTASISLTLLKYDFQFIVHRSSHQRCSRIRGVLRNFTEFTGKHLCQGLFLNKVAGLRTPPDDCFFIHFSPTLVTFQRVYQIHSMVLFESHCQVEHYFILFLKRKRHDVVKNGNEFSQLFIERCYNLNFQ